MNSQKLWEKVIAGEYTAINKQGCTLCGENARNYNERGFTVISHELSEKYHICENGRVKKYNWNTNKWEYIKNNK